MFGGISTLRVLTLRGESTPSLQVIETRRAGSFSHPESNAGTHAYLGGREWWKCWRQGSRIPNVFPSTLTGPSLLALRYRGETGLLELTDAGVTRRAGGPPMESNDSQGASILPNS